ncbi:hypothetical protein K7X08_027384 [Anisodus acutangulus]|uniref:Uncharacterized protein n=1 Tax=Anisodus acutangulus TaxID=402998 RepID=A0A9Q1RKY1_9SOLA|nr:hypothetical protein K7X08_027384 [Anisodus acutangulus]
MSRCFPFPPPGYEKKPKPEDGNLLKEEKRKEKKHKKEKKDKEKKEGKEKRDKDRSDGKHREKKDKKDKHQDKKEKHKDKKDKDKDKERSDISEEAKVVLPGASSGQKLPSGEHFKNVSINSEEVKFHAEKLFKSSLPAVETDESKFVQELARRIRDEQKGAVSQLAERFPDESKRYEKTNSMYIKDSGNLAKEREKNKERSGFSNKMDGQQVRVEPRIGANAILPSFPEMAKSKFHGLLPPLEENVDNRREEKEKSKERRDDKPRDKRNNKEKDAKSHGKEKEKKKEEKAKDKSAHRKIEQDKSRDINKSNFVGVSNTNHQVPRLTKDTIAGTVPEGNHRKRKDIETNGFLHESEVRPAKLLRPSSSHQPTLNGKRWETHQKTDMLFSNKQGVATDNIQVINKEQNLNGTIKLSNKHGVGTDIEMGNKEREVNGTIKLSNKHGVATDIQVINKEQNLNDAIKLSNKHGVATDIEVGNKECGANGTIKSQPLAVSKPKAPSVSPGADQIAEASKKPHPDSKYLNQILSVPKMDEWSGFDDQEWLFGSKSTLVRKPDMCLDEVKDNHVWSEPLQINSADVYALPYVIPY